MHGVKVRPPLFRDGTWIAEIVFVKIFNVRGIASEKVGTAGILLHHGMTCFFSIGIAGQDERPGSPMRGMREELEQKGTTV